MVLCQKNDQISCIAGSADLVACSLRSFTIDDIFILVTENTFAE